MPWKLDDNGNVNYACRFCGSFDTKLISKMLVGDPTDGSILNYFKLHSDYEYECNECLLKTYIDENTREIINDRIEDGLDEGDE